MSLEDDLFDDIFNSKATEKGQKGKGEQEDNKQKAAAPLNRPSTRPSEGKKVPTSPNTDRNVPTAPNRPTQGNSKTGSGSTFHLPTTPKTQNPTVPNTNRLKSTPTNNFPNNTPQKVSSPTPNNRPTSPNSNSKSATVDPSPKEKLKNVAAPRLNEAASLNKERREEKGRETFKKRYGKTYEEHQKEKANSVPSSNKPKRKVLPQKAKAVIGGSSEPFIDRPDKRKRKDLKNNLTGIGLTPGEKWNGLDESNRTLHYPGETAKISDDQFSFYKRLSSTRNRHRNGEDLFAPLREPIGRLETEQEKRKREQQKSRLIFDGEHYGGRKSYTQKDEDYLNFLATFKYSKANHLGNLHGVSERAAYYRLAKLKELGLVKSIGGTGVTVYTLTRSGYDLIGMPDAEPYTKSSFNPSTYAHHFMIVHTASKLWGATEDVLLEGKNYPHMGRRDRDGNPKPGNMLVSETSIRSSMGKMMGLANSTRVTPMRSPEVREEIRRSFQEWSNSGGVTFGPSPEFLPGNEYMWSLYPPESVGIQFHVPDLVIPRPRNRDGSPNSLLIEAERKRGEEQSYRNTMRAFKASRNLYKTMYWICSYGSPHRKIEAIAQEEGLIDSGLVKILPIIKDKKIYKGLSWDL